MYIIKTNTYIKLKLTTTNDQTDDDMHKAYLYKHTMLIVRLPIIYVNYRCNS